MLDVYETVFVCACVCVLITIVNVISADYDALTISMDYVFTLTWICQCSKVHFTYFLVPVPIVYMWTSINC